MTTTIKLIRNEDGTIDVNATCNSAYDHVYALAETEVESAQAIGAAVHAVFDTHLGKKVPMPAVCALAFANMECPYEDYATQEKAIKLFVRNSSEFSVNKGKGGGVVRDCDKPVKPSAS